MVNSVTLVVDSGLDQNVALSYHQDDNQLTAPPQVMPRAFRVEGLTGGGWEELARETDFLSIGTNDLIMYLLAVDRTNEQLSYLYRSHHPTVLRVLATIAEEAGDKREELSVCGDIASDPMLVPFLVGLGIRKLSVTPSSVEAVKQRIGNFSLLEAESISKEMLSIKRVPEMEEYMAAFEKRYSPVTG